MYNFDPYNVLLAIATNILMTGFVLQGHICAFYLTILAFSCYFLYLVILTFSLIILFTSRIFEFVSEFTFCVSQFWLNFSEFRFFWIISLNEWMNEWSIYIALYCVLLYTQSALQSYRGSLLNHHQCAASTWMMRRQPQDNGASALTTHQLQVERRER